MIGKTWKLTQATTWIVVFAAQPKARAKDQEGSGRARRRRK